ncbi:MAG: ionic transporter y4hA [Roseococcus sp.]|nr:ionic transporter y4hA [Roseococcus sp.]
MNKLPLWSWAVPLAGLALLFAWGTSAPALLVLAGLLGAVFAAVHHAETVAQRLGEPFGTLVLALSVTVLEAGMIVSIMLAGDSPTVARDSIFAALMIALNGILGLCLVLGGFRHFAQSFRPVAANALLVVLMPLALLTLVLPSHTTTTPGPVFSAPQLIFVSIIAFVLYGLFLYVQLVRHRTDFVVDHGLDGEPPSRIAAWLAFVLLLLALLVVILLAKKLSPTLEAGVAAIGAPVSVVGIVIAAIVLLPEGITAVKAAATNNMQTALNLALGSIVACVGLTIPAVAVVALYLGEPLHLGLDASMTVLLGLTFLLLAVTMGSGRTTVLEGTVHLAVFFAFLVFSFLP